MPNDHDHDVRTAPARLIGDLLTINCPACGTTLLLRSVTVS